MDVQTYYHEQLQRLGYAADAAQARAITQLQICYEAWQHYTQANPLKRWLTRLEPPQGVYLWGGVGRGKSFLMDCFYHVVPVKKKMRIHFHEFMREVHRELEQLRGHKDPLDQLAKKISHRYQLICFDELHISDIADAMILYRLLDQLFQCHVQFVMTSNYEPDDLYLDGLHRDRLLPAISLMKQKFHILNVDTGVDYRNRILSQAQVYFSPVNNENKRALFDLFKKMVRDQFQENKILQIEHRRLNATFEGQGVVWLDFQSLCGEPRSQNDYLELASRYHAIFLENVPKMDAQMASQARRFTWLVDVFYNHRIKLFILSEVPPTQLYLEGMMAHEFERTVSRLIEMQSKEYLEMGVQKINRSIS